MPVTKNCSKVKLLYKPKKARNLENLDLPKSNNLFGLVLTLAKVKITTSNRKAIYPFKGCRIKILGVKLFFEKSLSKVRRFILLDTFYPPGYPYRMKIGYFLSTFPYSPQKK